MGALRNHRAFYWTCLLAAGVLVRSRVRQTASRFWDVVVVEKSALEKVSLSLALITFPTPSEVSICRRFSLAQPKWTVR